METYNKKNFKTKISKIDQQLQYLETLVPNGIIKESLKEDMKSKKKCLSKKLTQDLKKKRIFNEPKNQDQKVNTSSQYVI